MSTIITDLKTIVEQGYQKLEKTKADKAYIFFEKDAQVSFSFMLALNNINFPIQTVEMKDANQDLSLQMLVLASQLAVSEENNENVTVVQKIGGRFDFKALINIGVVPFKIVDSFDDLIGTPSKKPVLVENNEIKATIPVEIPDKAGDIDLMQSDAPIVEQAKEHAKKTRKTAVKAEEKEPEDELMNAPALITDVEEKAPLKSTGKSTGKRAASTKTDTEKASKNSSATKEVKEEPEEKPSSKAKQKEEPKRKDTEKSDKEDKKGEMEVKRQKKVSGKYMTNNTLPFFELSEKAVEVEDDSDKSIVDDNVEKKFLSLIEKYDKKNMNIYKTCFSQLYFIMQKSYNKADCGVYIDSFLSAYEPEIIKKMLLPHYEEFAKLFRD